MPKATIATKTCRPEGFGADVRVLEAGSGPPVVLLHGNPDNADEWRPVMQRLSGDFRCLAPDLPGYGTSERLPADFSYGVDAQVAFLDAVLRACDVTEPIIVVMHDIGGMVAVPWAAGRLSRVRAVVVTNTVAFEGFEWFPLARVWGARGLLGRASAGLVMVAIGLAGGARFRRAFAAQNPQLGADEVQRMTRTFALNPVAKRACLRQFREIARPAFFSGFDAMNRRIAGSVPVKVVWGDGDPYVPTRHAQRFATDDVQVLPNVGHWTPLVAPEAVAAAVRSLALETRA